MTDIVERLRNPPSMSAWSGVMHEAADKIAQLQAALAEETACARQTDHALAKAEAECERLRAALKECADDLASYIEHHYAHAMDYPYQKLKYDREMQPVLDARSLLEKIK